MINLAGLWKCKSAKGMYLIHQDGKKISIYGMGVNDDNFDVYGFGKIGDDEKFIWGRWADTPYSANPENYIPHTMKIKIVNDSKLNDVTGDGFSFGDFEKVNSIKELRAIVKKIILAYALSM